MRPEGQARAGVGPRSPDADAGVDRRRDHLHGAGVGVHGHVGGNLGRSVAHEDEDEHGEQDAEAADASERDAPRGGVQEERERHEGEQLPRLAEDAGDLDHERRALRGEPQCGQSQHSGEDRRVACSQQESREDRDADARRERHRQLADGHQHHADRHHRTRAVPVEQHADGDLHASVDGELDHSEQRERGGIRLEALSGVDAHRRQGRPVRDCQDIGRRTHHPDGPCSGAGGAEDRGNGHLSTVPA